MTESIKYILIDDDVINNTICKLCIKKSLGDVNIVAFTNPKKGFEYIVSEYSNSSSLSNAILFLDINMPEITGWDFLKLFEDLDETIKKSIKIYLLSSSINQQDIEKANLNKNVISFISKPLSKEVLINIKTLF